jgi:hypothetical protein
MHNYIATFDTLPPSMAITPTVTNDNSWSIHGRIMPYLDQINFYDKIDLQQSWSSATNGPIVSGNRVPVYICPSDAKTDEPRLASGVYLYCTNYGFNFGTWFVYDPVTGQGGNGLFYPNSRIRMASIRDGSTNTLLASEVRSWQAYTGAVSPPSTAQPLTVADVVAAVDVGLKDRIQPATADGTGHTEWANGQSQHSGFTTTLPPNTNVVWTWQGVTYDVDFASQGEGGPITTLPSYSALTSRSYHAGIVNSLMGDGSVKSVGKSIDAGIWRAAGTRAGGEIGGGLE